MSEASNLALSKLAHVIGFDDHGIGFRLTEFDVETSNLQLSKVESQNIIWCCRI